MLFTTRDYEIWKMERSADNWSDPISLGPIINCFRSQYSSCVTDDGTLYYMNAKGIVLSAFIKGRYTGPEPLGKDINSNNYEGPAYVAPDESYLIFSSFRPGGYGSSDLYISFREEDGTWSAPKNMGPKINSDGRDRLAFVSSDGKEIYFSRLVRETDQPKNVIMVVKYQHEQWVGPETAPFSGKYNDTNPSMSPDGNRLYFSSNRPVEKDGKLKQDRDIWYLEKNNNRWGEPIHLEGPVNSNMNDDAVSVSSKGSMYFYRKFEKEEGWGEIFRSHFTARKWSEPERLGATINTDSYECFPVVAPDEDFLIFYRLNHAKGVGQYICFKQSDGIWTAPINMGETINGGAVAFSSNFSPDGKYLFVLRRRNDSIIKSPETFKDGIYWVDAKIIEELKPGELKQETRMRINKIK